MKNLSREAKVINVFNKAVMQGKKGAVAMVNLPSVEGEFCLHFVLKVSVCSPSVEGWCLSFIFRW